MHAVQGRVGGNTMKYYVYELAEGFSWKMSLSLVGTVIASIEHFYGEIVWGFLILFGLDLATGILKSYKNKVSISSKRLRDSVTKLLAYMLLITALIIASKYETSFVPVVTCAYYYFMFTELKSIFENVEEMGVKIPSFIKGKVDHKIDEYDKKQDDNKTNL